MSSRSSRTEPSSDTGSAVVPGQPGNSGRPHGTVAVARVLRPVGLQGEVVAEVLSDVPGRLDPGRELLVSPAKQDGVTGSRLPARLTIASRRAHRSGTVLRFAGVAGREAAAALRGAWLEVDESEVPAAPEGTYYYFQLLGCSCSDRGEHLGEVVDLREDGGGLLLVVSDGAREVDVPFVRTFLRRIDIARGMIELVLPPGLVETCASRS